MPARADDGNGSLLISGREVAVLVDETALRFRRAAPLFNRDLRQSADT